MEHIYYLDGISDPVVMRLIMAKDDSGQYFLSADPKKMKKPPNGLGEYLEEIRDPSSLYRKTEPFSISQISHKFAKLRSKEAILDFASTYGLLGLKPTHPDVLKYDFYYLDNFEFEASFVESVDAWEWHIHHVRKLMELYTTLKNEGDILDILEAKPCDELDPPLTLLHLIHSQQPPEENSRENSSRPVWVRIKKGTGDRHTGIWPKPEKGNLHFHWVVDGKPTKEPYMDLENLDADEEYLKYVAYCVLRDHILTFVKQGVFVDFERVKEDPASPIGFYCEDRKATNHLLAAIYYDLWQTVNDRKPMEVCKYCNDPFIPARKGQMFCKKVCTKRHERKMKQLEQASAQ